MQYYDSCKMTKYRKWKRNQKKIDWEDVWDGGKEENE